MSKIIKLNKEQLEEKSRELAQTIQALATVQAEKKLAMKEFKAQTDTLEMEIARLAQVIRTGEEILPDGVQLELLEEVHADQPTKQERQASNQGRNHTPYKQPARSRKAERQPHAGK